MRKDAQQISIVTAPINIPKEEMFDCAIRDHVLSGYICQFRKELEKQGIEVFARKENIIATERGYYSAMYTDDIRNMEGGIDNPVPFKGKDGRMKVDIIAEDGKHSIQDLALLIAMAYCPNPARFKKVWFKDSRPENVNADNLYFVSSFDYLFLKSFYNTKEWMIKKIFRSGSVSTPKTD